MKSLFVIIVSIVSLAAIAVILFYHQLQFEDVTNDVSLYIVPALFIFPVIVAIVGLFIVAVHPKAYRYSPMSPSEEEDDPILHNSVGLLIGVLQDLSRGMIAENSMYEPTLRKALEAEMMQYQVFIDRGYAFVFAFHHNEAYHAQIVHIISSNEIVVQIDGLFDYYFERSGDKRLSPHLYHREDPFIRVPGMVRVRMVRASEQSPWKVCGFSENLRGLSLGLAVR
ncbi:MAG: hypothetical protein ABIG66_04960 [Candidatus Kerfeldbacteria bacterium]